ncbi:uncharacterized protein LOC135477103 [Liolophura sinensis]|uniref:uncharacterized protein LOC135477103 n=1 Tax=Liolophura sinensis TaxID=3198878 RepID=UPI0031580EFD
MVTYEEPISRQSYQPPPGLHRINPLRGHKRYFTDLKTTFSSLCHDLLSQETLPYNPYPKLITALRKSSEKFHFYQQSDADILRLFNKPVEKTAVPHLYHTPTDPPVYGLSSLLQLVDPRGVDQYRWLMENVTPPLADLPSLPGHSIQVLMALTGPAVFTGTFYRHPQRVHLRQEYLVTGSDLTKVTDLFVSSVIQDLNRMEKKQNHKVIGIHVPSQDATPQETLSTNETVEEVALGTPWTDVLWEVDRVHLEKDNFVKAVTNAVLGNQMVTMECVFCLDPDALVFVFGEKQSTLNFVEISEKDTDEGLSTFTQFPLATLHEGVFLKKSHAEAYMGMFLPQLLGQKPHRLVVHDKASSVTMTTKRGDKNSTAATKGQKYTCPISLSGLAPGYLGLASGSWLSGLAPGCLGPASGCLGLVPGCLGLLLAAWVQLLAAWPSSWLSEPSSWLSGSGSWLSGPSSWLYGPSSWLSGPSSWLSGPSFWLPGSSFWLSGPSSWLSGTSSWLPGPSSWLPGPSSWLPGSSSWLSALAPGCLPWLLAVWVQLLAAWPSSWLSGPSSWLSGLAPGCLGLAPGCLGPAPGCLGLAPGCLGLAPGCLGLAPGCLGLASGCLGPAPGCLAKCLKNAQKAHAQKILLEAKEKPRTKTKQIKGSKGQNPNPASALSEYGVVVHGMEELNLRKHDLWVIRVAECAKTDPSPKAINSEAVLMKYLLDIHLDDVWWNYLVELFSSDVTPPNPYPRLINSLRRAALKMDLWFEEEEMLSQKIFSGVSKPTHDFPFVHVIPGCGAHGSAGIMSVLNAEGYFTLSSLAQDFIPKFYIQMKGLFRVARVTAVTGQSALYGVLVPHLSTLELDEHIYIKGPEGCSTEAIQLCANIVHKEILDLINKGDHPVTGVYFGAHQNRLTMRDVKKRPQAFLSEFEATCHKKQQIFLKAYIAEGWRYYPVIKHYRFHWLTEKSSEPFYPTDPSEFYKSIFFEKERAVFYHQTSKFDLDDPQSYPAVRSVCAYLDQMIAQVIRDKHEYFHVHKLLCTQALVKQDKSLLMESWRMFHSLAGQVEYVNTLNSTLQDLVGFALERKIESKSTRKQNIDENDTAVKSGQSSDTDNTDSVLSPLNLDILNQTAVAFRQKIIDVTQSGMTLSSPRIPTVLHRKLESVFLNSKLLVQEQTIAHLEEIKNMMAAISNMVSCDLHETLPLASYSVDRILAGPDARSRRVLSAKLDRPETILKRPRARKTMGYDFD